MTDADVEAFDDYWRIILRNEEYVRQWGHNPRPARVLELHQDLEDAYTRVQPLLSSVIRQRLFSDLPFGHHPFAADNFHHALVKLLNPPENWFERVGVLTSPEYLAIKQGAADEEKGIEEANISAVLTNLTGFQMAILGVMNDQPMYWKEIARIADLDETEVRRQSKFFQNHNLIAKHSRGFTRTVRLPTDGG